MANSSTYRNGIISGKEKKGLLALSVLLTFFFMHIRPNGIEIQEINGYYALRLLLIYLDIVVLLLPPFLIRNHLSNKNSKLKKILLYQVGLGTFCSTIAVIFSEFLLRLFFLGELLDQSFFFFFLPLVGLISFIVNLSITINYKTNIKKVKGSMDKTYFIGQVGSSTIQIASKQIACFFIESKLVYIVNMDGERYVTTKTLDQLEVSADKNLFFRLNRQYIVSKDAVTKITPIESRKLEVSLDNFDRSMIVSKKKSPAFKKWINNDVRFGN